jgi:hypothetical protein
MALRIPIRRFVQAFNPDCFFVAAASFANLASRKNYAGGHMHGGGLWRLWSIWGVVYRGWLVTRELRDAQTSGFCGEFVRRRLIATLSGGEDGAPRCTVKV